MSGIGHFAAGFAARPAAPQAPLWALLVAGEANDLLYFLFTTLGIEPKASIAMDFTHGVRYLTPGSNPWSHGFFMSAVWAGLAAVVAFLWCRNRRTASVIGLVVLSHWGLDFLMHSNLPLFFDGSPSVGLGLENSGPGFIFMTALDLALLAGGVALYLYSRRRTNSQAQEGQK